MRCGASATKQNGGCIWLMFFPMWDFIIITTLVLHSSLWYEHVYSTSLIVFLRLLFSDLYKGKQLHLDFCPSYLFLVSSSSHSVCAAQCGVDAPRLTLLCLVYYC